MRRYFAIAAFPILLVIAAQVLNHARDGMVALDGKFIGLDGYTHLLRAKQFVETGDWFDHSIHRGNPPDGDTLYWPRPFDAILLVGAAALSPFTDFDTAMHLWGIFVSPVLHLLSLLVLLWAVRPLFDDRGLVYLGVLFAFQLFIVHIASIARPDHHGLLALLFVWLLGAGLRLVSSAATARTALMAALPAISSLWISLEALVAIAAMFVALGIGWIGGRANFALKTAVFALALTLGFALTLPLEHGFAGFRMIAFDAPSVVHLALLGLIAAASLVILVVDRRVRLCRLIEIRLPIGLAAAGSVAGGMWFLYPKFYAGPLVDVDPEVIALWFNYIAEFAPLIDFDDLSGSLSRFVFHLGPALPTLPFLIHHGWTGTGDRRRMWLLLLLFAAVYVALAVNQQRWTGFAQYVVVIGYAGLLVTLLDRLARGRAIGYAAARALLVVLFIFGFLFVGTMLPRKALLAGGGPACPITEMSRWLGEEPGLNERPRRIMSFINFGPELLYRTRHQVIATPNHRNGASILDTIHALGRLPPAEAWRIIERRKVDLILVCLGTEEANDYRQGNDGKTLFAAIEGGTAPPWLRAIPLPEPLAEGFRLLEVVR